MRLHSKGRARASFTRGVFRLLHQAGPAATSSTPAHNGLGDRARLGRRRVRPRARPLIAPATSSALDPKGGRGPLDPPHFLRQHTTSPGASGGHALPAAPRHFEKPPRPTPMAPFAPPYLLSPIFYLLIYDHHLA
jgi:hypothetical protein